MYNGEFTCSPLATSNYDVFKLVNKNLSEDKAHEIWQYYRQLFINTKLFGDGLSEFRKTLQRFIEGKSFSNYSYKAASASFHAVANRIGDINSDEEERINDINSYIGLARWLELQYNCDIAIDELSADWDKDSLEHATQRISGTVPFNNYVSYFTPDPKSKLRNSTDYETRKLKVRSVYAYTHKQIRWHICASEYGATKLWVHTKHNPFMDMFERHVKNGVTINVVTSKVLCNIDQSTPYIKIDNFFIDD